MNFKELNEIVIAHANHIERYIGSYLSNSILKNQFKEVIGKMHL